MKYLFTEGEEVYHVNNLEQKMCILEIKKKKIKLSDGKVLDKMLGIEVCWWGEDKNYYKERFHSRLLIPGDIIKQGQEKINEFINNQTL